MPCDQRQQPQQCETELTSGESWDSSANKCWWDPKLWRCRWTDECIGHKTAGQCGKAQCSWETVCTPPDMRFLPGPNVCIEACMPGNRPERAVNASTPTPSVAASATAAPAPPPPRPAAAPSTTPTVSVSTGDLQGIYVNGGKVEAYLGIPFAEAPVGALRWAAPKPLSAKWSGVFQATAYGAACSQNVGYFMADKEQRCEGFTRPGHPTAGTCKGYSEDCLNLNIFTPSTSGKRPVMVWIHGGCFVSGSASNSQYNGAPLAEAHDVVVVTVQYRLGVFGFLADASLRPRDPLGTTGGYGLLDNIAALQWLQTNVARFGGDPDMVTIFGESSGAGSVSQLLGVEASWPYFHRAIMESGTGSFWTYISTDAAKGSFDKVTANTKCDGADDVVSCLLAAPSNLVSGAVSAVPCRDACTWAPVIDGVLIKGRTVEVARAHGLRPDTPVISGFNLNDGAAFVTGWPLAATTMTNASLASYFSNRFGEFAVGDLYKTFPVPAGTVAGWITDPFYSAQECETDFSYACTAEWVASAMVDQGQAHYVYQFSEPTYQSSLAVHGDEIRYVFGTLASGATASQQQTSTYMMAYWSNFAKYGNPNADGLPEWPQWSSAGKLINITSSPVIDATPKDSFHGCPLFDSNWDYFGSCLPP